MLSLNNKNQKRGLVRDNELFFLLRTALAQAAQLACMRKKNNSSPLTPPLLFKLLLIFLLFFSSFSASIAFAAEPLPKELIDLKAALAADLKNSAYDTCQSKLVPLYDLEMLTFFKYLEETFENKSANSTMVNLGIVRYTRFKSALNEHFLALKPIVSSEVKNYDEIFVGYKLCGRIKDTYIVLGKEKLIEHIKKNNIQKKTTMLLEKFKAINQRLRDYNQTIAEVYSGYVALNNKLPGFLRKCITN